MRLYVFIVSLLLIACESKRDKIFLSLGKGDMVLEGYATKDSVFTDTVFYYDAERRLLRKDKVKDGQMDGISIDYYANQRPRTISYYTNGLKNGSNSYFDTLGRCYYRDFYYYDLPAGPILYFENNGRTKRYFFVNLQNETLVDIDYPTWEGMSSIDTRCINFTSHVQRTDSTNKLFVLVYLMRPPKLSFEYSVVKKKKEAEDNFTDVLKITNDFPFKNLVLPELPGDENYAVRLNVFDSLLNKQTVIFKEVN